MHVLFVHGMGRSPLSGWPLLRQLRRAGMQTRSFGYAVSLEDFARIRARLATRIEALAAEGDYLLIGHSLGGVLIRSALGCLPEGVGGPRHVFLLGSPQQPSRIAVRLGSNPLFRLLTRDCGQLLGSAARMAEVGPVAARTTSVAGTRGLPWKRGPFGGEPNDGVVALSEVTAGWLIDQIQIPQVHALLPASRRVARIILERIGQPATVR